MEDNIGLTLLERNSTQGRLSNSDNECAKDFNLRTMSTECLHELSCIVFEVVRGKSVLLSNKHKMTILNTSLKLLSIETSNMEI